MIEKPVNAQAPVRGYGKKLPTNWMINYGAACMLTFGAMLDTVTSWLKAVNSLLCNTISTRAGSPAPSSTNKGDQKMKDKPRPCSDTVYRLITWCEILAIEMLIGIGIYFIAIYN